MININEYFDKIFYINMEKDIDRNINILSEFEKYDITNYERFQGIVCDEISPEPEWRNFIHKHEKYIKGNIGSRLSHIGIIKLAKERNYKKIMILEDDIKILVDPNTLLNLNKSILNQWDMIYFGGHIETECRNDILCIHAYCVNETLFDNIIHMTIPSGMEMDTFYSKIIQHMTHVPNRYCKYDIEMIKPFNSIIQGNFGSNIK